MNRPLAAVRWCAWALNLTLFMLLVPVFQRAIVGATADISRHARRAARAALRIFGVTVMTEGLASLDPREPLLFICNHRSWIDSLVLIGHLPHAVRIMVADKYFRYPVLGAALRLHGYYPVARGLLGEPRAPLAQIVDDLRAGQSVIVYPEGTRSTTDEMLPFRHGAFTLAARSRRRLVPLFLYGTGAVLPKGASLLSIRPGPVALSIGRPETIAAADTETPAEVARVRFAYLTEYASRRQAARRS